MSASSAGHPNENVLTGVLTRGILRERPACLRLMRVQAALSAMHDEGEPKKRVKGGRSPTPVLHG
eukprot:365609-Chlamydomonas_euryale.AAC.1